MALSPHLQKYDALIDLLVEELVREVESRFQTITPEVTASGVIGSRRRARTVQSALPPSTPESEAPL